MIDDNLFRKTCRSLILFLMVAVVFAVWNGNMTAIEIKNIIVQVICIIVMGITVMRLLLKEKYCLQLNPLLVAAGLYGLIMIGGYLGSNRSSLNYNNFVPQIFGLILFFLISVYFSKNDIRKICLLLVIIAGIASLYGIIQFLDMDPMHWVHKAERYKMISFFGHKNYFALYLLLMIPLGLYLLFTSSELTIKVPVIIASFSMFFALFLSTSRGAVAGLIFALILSASAYWLIKRNVIKSPKVFWGIIGAIPLLLLIVVCLLPGNVRQDFSRLASGEEMSVRTSFYKAATEIIAKKPYFGVGPGNFVVSYPRNEKHKTLTADPNQVLNHVHNDYLEIWVEYGIFALLLYVGILLLFFKISLAALTKTDDSTQQLLHIATSCSLVGYLFYSTFTVAGRYMSSAFFLWVVIGIGYVSFQSSLQNTKTITITNRLYGNSKLTGVAFVVILVLFGGLGKTAVASYVADVKVHRASLQTMKGDYQKALVYLEQALALNKKEVEAYYQRGYVNFNINLYEQAIDDYEQVQRLAPDYVNIAFNTASCYYRKNDWANAIKYAAISHAHFPGYEPNTVMLAFCHYYIQQPHIALNYCNLILNRNPNHEKILGLQNTLRQILQRS